MSEDNVYWNGYQWKQKLLEPELREIGDVATGEHSDQERGVAVIDDGRVDCDASASYESTGQVVPIRSLVERADGRSLADEPDRELGDETVIVRDLKALEEYCGKAPGPDAPNAVVIPLTLRPEKIVLAPNKEIPDPLIEGDIYPHEKIGDEVVITPEIRARIRREMGYED